MNAMTLAIHWLCETPTPYNNALFAEVARRAPGRFLVHFVAANLGEHESLLRRPTGFSWRHVASAVFDYTLCRAALSPDSFFVVGGWQRPLHWLIFLMASGRFATWTDVPDPTARRSWLRQNFRRLILAFAFSRARAILATGAPGLAALERLGASRAKLVNFPYWVRVPAQPEPLPASGTPVVFGAVGRLVPRKGFDILLAAAAELARTAEVDFRIQIVGDGPERAALQEQARMLKATNIVTFLGWRSAEEVRAALLQMHVLVHPARFEPFGVVVLEAMALGRPVIASDQTMAAVDRVRPGVNGWLATAGDARALTRAMQEALLRRDRLAEMGVAAHAVAREWPLSRGADEILRIATACAWLAMAPTA